MGPPQSRPKTRLEIGAATDVPGSRAPYRGPVQEHGSTRTANPLQRGHMRYKTLMGFLVSSCLTLPTASAEPQTREAPGSTPSTSSTFVEQGTFLGQLAARANLDRRADDDIGPGPWPPQQGPITVPVYVPTGEPGDYDFHPAVRRSAAWAHRPLSWLGSAHAILHRSRAPSSQRSRPFAQQALCERRQLHQGKSATLRRTGPQRPTTQALECRRR